MWNAEVNSAFTSAFRIQHSALSRPVLERRRIASPQHDIEPVAQRPLGFVNSRSNLDTNRSRARASGTDCMIGSNGNSGSFGSTSASRGATGRTCRTARNECAPGATRCGGSARVRAGLYRGELVTGPERRSPSGRRRRSSGRAAPGDRLVRAGTVRRRCTARSSTRRMRHRPAILVDDLARDDDAFAERFARVLARQIVVGLAERKIPVHRCGEVAEVLRQPDERLRRRAPDRRLVWRVEQLGLGAGFSGYS